MKRSLVSPSFLKQTARRLKKEKSLSQSVALDEAARLYGFSNYKNYLNFLEANSKRTESSKAVLFQRLTTEKELSRKVSAVVTFIQERNAPFRDLLDILKVLSDSKEAVQSVCDKLPLSSKIQDLLLSYFLTDESKAELQKLPLLQNFVAKEVSVKSLVYRVDGDSLQVEGGYDLKLEFEFEVPDEHRSLPHFNRQPMFGDFEMAIDRKKQFVVMSSSIGEKVDGTLYTASFR